ncbi:MAG: tetratricopeptide repeat protein [Planctomycetota bacterium]
MAVYTGEICSRCGRPILVDEKSPSVARCRTCGAPYHTRCWFAGNEKCSLPGCEGKASDIKESRVAPVGDICPFLPPTPPRREGDAPQPAACLKVECALFDAAEGRCSLGEIAYTLATVRQSGRDTRRVLLHATDRHSQHTGRLLAEVGRRLGAAEGHMRGGGERHDKLTTILSNIAGLLQGMTAEIQNLKGDDEATSQGFERLAAAIEATGTGEQVRFRREARLAARSALRDGRPAAAVNLLRKAMERGPDDEVAGDLATALAIAGKPDEARVLTDKVLERSPQNTPCRLTLASLMLQAGEASTAEQLLAEAPDTTDPMLRAELAYAKACAAYAVGRAEEAVGLLNETLDLEPWHAPAASALTELRALREGAAIPQPAAIAQTALEAEPVPPGGSSN